MKRKILLLFLLFSATLQLNAQCTNYVSAEAISIDGDDICFGDIIFFDIIITTNGEPIGEGYDIEVTGLNDAFGFGFGDDSGFGSADLIIDFIEGCDPVEVFADFAVFCGTTGELLDNFSAGPFNVYPELTVDVVPPGCNPDENGSATLITFNGDICQGPVEGMPGAAGGDCDTQQPGTLSYNFTAFPGTPCEQIIAQDIETPCAGLPDGCTDPTACNYDPNAACEDGSCIFEPCCPRPLPDQFPTAICPFSTDEYCITFDGDISEIDEGSLFLDSEFGSFGFINSINPAENQICLIIDGFPFEPCMPTADNFMLSYFCPNLGQDVFITDIMIDIYPEPFEYEVFVQPATECGGLPTLISPPCGDLVIGNIVDPINDCDDPILGVIPYDIDPGFPIAPDAPDCFTAALAGEVPIQPCLEECPCDGAFCDGVCIELMVSTINFPTASCPDDGFDFQLDITGTGADFANYFISIYDGNNNNVFFDVHNSGDPTSYFPFVFSFLEGCTPDEQTFTYEIECQNGGILAAGTLGIITVYPSPFNFFPNITPSIACTQDLVIESICGTIVFDPDPIPVPGCGGTDTQVNWSVDFGFEYPPECAPFPIEGTETIFACPGAPGDPCDDFNPCTINDVLDENCNCVSEAPSVTLDSTLPTDICEIEPLILTVTIDSPPGPDGLFVAIDDQFGFLPGLVFVGPGDPLTLEVDAFFFNDNFPCGTSSYDLTLELLCGLTFAPVSSPIDLGTVTVYPPADVNNPVGGACTDTVTDNCGNATILYSTDGFTTPGTTTPPTLNPGDADITVSWIATTGGTGCEATGEYTLTCPGGENIITVDISDPCSCEAGIGTCPATGTPPGNIDVNGDGMITEVDYVADVITITVEPPVPGQGWEIANPGNALDCTGASIGPAGLTDQGGGIFTITVYYPANGSGFGTMTFANDMGETVSITNPSADYTACDCSAPTPSTCDLNVLTADFACDQNGTPNDATDDVVGGFSITVSDAGGAAGTTWIAEDGLGNTTTGAYGTPTVLTPTTMYNAGDVVTLVITDTANPDCSTTLDVTIENCAVTEQVPTLGEWSLIILTLLMSIVAVIGIRQRTTTIAYQEIEK